MENNFIYLDNASTTPLSENVLNIIIQLIGIIGITLHLHMS